MSSFFWRLFEHKDKKIEWAMHTAYSCDIGYAQVLLGMQYDVNPDSAEKYVSNNRTAFFYNKTKKSPGLVGNRMGKTATVNMNKILFSVSGEVQTFHAKISLVCFSNEEGEKSYRMAVYSKNLTYNDSCAEISLLFNLDTNREGKVEKQNGFQLESYLKKLRDACSDDQGKEWIYSSLSW